jgi:hypothetical protein
VLLSKRKGMIGSEQKWALFLFGLFGLFVIDRPAILGPLMDSDLSVFNGNEIGVCCLVNFERLCNLLMEFMVDEIEGLLLDRHCLIIILISTH